MNVNNRKLFANRDARRRLSEMGGIVASMPELLGVAQQAGAVGRLAQAGRDRGLPISHHRLVHVLAAGAVAELALDAVLGAERGVFLPVLGVECRGVAA